MWKRGPLITAGLILAGQALPAIARPSLAVEAATDDRRRGISWSQGDPVLRANFNVPITHDLALESDATTLSGSQRHGGADAVIGLGARYGVQLNGWRLGVEGRYHFFTGASGQNFGEIGARTGNTLGPATIDIFLRYAPKQWSVGGDNLHVGAETTLSIPSTPFTFSAEIGRSSGHKQDSGRSIRLRPVGRYWNYGLGIDYHHGPVSAGIGYSATNIRHGSRLHAGNALIVRVGLSVQKFGSP